MSDPAYDNFDHGSLSVSVSNPAALEAQQLLQLLGYSPGEMNGFWDQSSKNAVQALWMALGEKSAPPSEPTPELLQKLRQLVARGLPHMQLPVDPMRAPAQSLADKTATKRPAWLSSGFLAAGLGAAVLGYFWWKEQQEGEGASEGAAALSTEGEKLAGTKKTKTKAKDKETCARTPVLPFESGAALAPVSEASALSEPSPSAAVIDVTPSTTSTTAPPVLP